VSAAVVLVHVVAVVAGNGSNSGSLRNLQHVGDDLALLFEAVVVDLEEEAVFSEDVLVFSRGFLGNVEATGKNVGGNLPI
jgi:hypothetical protein